MLCARDAKFAVECDTCKMSYCLVCLASGTKDPCVRCGHRTSKRVEQLVHLRLKSIYKAFKQSGAALSGNNNGKGGNGHNSNNRDGGLGNRNDSFDDGDHNRNSKRRGDSHSSVSEKQSLNESSVSMPLPASMQRYAELHGKDLKKRQNLKGDVGAVLQVAAAAAASAVASASSTDEFSRHGGVDRKGNKDYFSDSSTNFNDADFDMGGRHYQSKGNSSNNSDRFSSRTQAEADAAAAALLAELDEEKLQTEASNKAKKSKKKKKKERQAAAKEKEKEEVRLKEEEELRSKAEAEKLEVENSNKKKENKEAKKSSINSSTPLSVENPASQNFESNDNDSEDDDITRLAETKMYDTSHADTAEDRDESEKRLADLISTNDLEGIETLLEELKGVPGRAAIRKNAKKAVKRIKEEQNAQVAAAQQERELNRSNHNDLNSNDDRNQASTENNSTAYKAPEPLLKIVSRNSRVITPGQAPRHECVMHMAPSVVGWVIGKGGQRIRDLMEESGAKVWIDQDSMGPNDMRNVYVSGNKKSIDIAVSMVKDLVSKAPVGGTTTHGTTASTYVHSVNDTSSVTSTRSSLTSTPVSLVHNFTQQAPAMAEKPTFSPLRKSAPSGDHLNAPKSPNPSLVNATQTPSPALSSPLKLPSMPMPPPGMEGFSDTSVENSPLNMKTTVNDSPRLQQRPPQGNRAVHELTCEPRFVPLLIGRRGWTVKQIQDTSGARVDIDQTVTPRRIIISGDADQVNRAVNMVRQVLSYPHAKHHYSARDLNGGDTDESMIAANSSTGEDFFKGFSDTSSNNDDALFRKFSLGKEDHLPPLNTNQHIPKNIPIEEHNPNPISMVKQSDNGLQGLNMFGVASIPTQMKPKLQMSQSSTFNSNTTTQSSVPSDHLYMHRQHSASLTAGHQNLDGSSDSHQYRNQPNPSETFQYENIMHLSSQMRGMGPTQINNAPFTSIIDQHNNNMESNHVLRQGMSSQQRYPQNHSFSNQHQNRISTDQDAVNNMFGNKVDDSLLSSFNNFSFGNQETESNLGSNFFDFLSQDVSDKPATEERSFGLGGVRLDNDMNGPNDHGHFSASHHDNSKWSPR